MLSIDKSITVPYDKDSCFDAILSILPNIPRCSIESNNKLAGSISAKTSAGISSYGEIISITIQSTTYGSIITASSAPKMPYLLWKNQNTKNVDDIINAFSKYASEKLKVKSSVSSSPNSPSIKASSTSTIDRLNKLKSLYEAGAITEDEYKNKRQKIVDEI